MIKPAHLKIGDNIGIVSPSSTIKDFNRRFNRGILALKKMGLNPIIGKNAKKKNGYTSGTPEERASDINYFFKDKTIKAIICSTGGNNSNSIISLLDYNLIKKNPKIFCGFSDITAINIAIFKKTKMVTFNGPTVLPTFGEFNIHKFSVKWFKKVLFKNKIIGNINYPKKFTDEFLLWDKEDNRERKTKISKKPKFLLSKNVKGILIGGNLSTLCLLGGTKFFPNFKNSILFLEEDSKNISEIEAKLVYLEQLEVFKKIKGLLFGRGSIIDSEHNKKIFYDILINFGKKYNIAIIVDVDCGHTSPLITFPLGIHIFLNGDKKQISFLDSAVY
ncbi:MAG: LD-carboxypeptidase [Candidatus Nanoarchaeia archaeon]|nr:LD-carboxypeptidase [Candidatus Nanoarchaeia archaeon]